MRVSDRVEDRGLTKEGINSDSTWSVNDSVNDPGRILKRAVMRTQLVTKMTMLRRANATPMPSIQAAS